MGRTTNRLTNLAVKDAKEPGRYADGGGLYLVVDAKGGRRWFYFFQWRGKRVEMGLGALADRTLAQARDARDEARKLVVKGENPVEVRKAEKAAKEAAEAPEHTFASWAREVAPVVAPQAVKAHAAWVRMMTEWVGAMKDKAPDQIRTEDVLAALKPYWKTRPETGRRMRMRIEAVLDAAKAKGLIPDPWQNPARWKGHLQHLIEKRATAVKHHKAMPYGDVPAFVQLLAERDTMASHALRFTILTVGRTSEVVYAKWPEIDLEAKVWTVPKERMKMKREHRVPLTAAALDVLGKATPPAGQHFGGWVFPSFVRKGKPLSTAAMDRVLDDMGLAGVATVHGFRSSFRDWAGDATNFERDTIEAALAHLVGDETERAYRRGDALLKRRKLMEAWAGYLARKAGGNVVGFGRPT